MGMCGILGRLQGVHLICDLDTFKQNWNGGVSFIRAQQQALQLLKELVAPQAQDILKAKRYLFEVATQIASMTHQMRALPTKNTFIHFLEYDSVVGRSHSEPQFKSLTS